MRQPFSCFEDYKTFEGVHSRGQSGVLASGRVFKVIAVFGPGDIRTPREFPPRQL